MRPLLLHLAVVLPLGLGPNLAQATQRPPTSPERAAHARKVIRALDDYDAQIARRQRQLQQEMRASRRRSGAR